MKKLINNFLSFYGLRIIRTYNIASTSSLQSKRVIPWFECSGDSTLRLDYKLDENSLVIDLGGYEGEWSANIFCKYSSNILIFEPVLEFYSNIVRRFSHNKKIKVFNFGLASVEKKERLSLLENSTSFYKKSDNSIEVIFKNAEDFFISNQIKNVDLIKINIEGGEYEFLEKLIQSNLITLFDNLQIQFHDFVPDAYNRMKLIQNELLKTHYLTYSFEFVWENWKRK